MMGRRTWFVILLAVVALVAIPLASGACRCCRESTTSCCSRTTHQPCGQSPDGGDGGRVVATCNLLPGPAIPAPSVEPASPTQIPPSIDLVQVEVASHAPTPLLLRFRERPPRPRTPLVEGGACLHTTIQPPATASV